MFSKLNEIASSMNFVNYLNVIYSIFFPMTARISRSQYIRGSALFMACRLVLAFIISSLFVIKAESGPLTTLKFNPLSLVNKSLILPILILSSLELYISIKSKISRLHDLNLSGNSLLVYFVFMMLFYINFSHEVALYFGIAFSVLLSFLPGDSHTNNFGLPPGVPPQTQVA